MTPGLRPRAGEQSESGTSAGEAARARGEAEGFAVTVPGRCTRQRAALGPSARETPRVRSTHRSGADSSAQRRRSGLGAQRLVPGVRGERRSACMRAARNESRRARPPAAASSRETQLPRPPARREAVPAPLPAGGAGDPAGRLPPAPASPAARRPRPAERTKGRSSGGRAAEAPAGGSGAVGAGPLRGRGRGAGRARWWGGRGARPRAAEREGAGRGARARCAGRVRLHLRDFSPCKLSPRERRLAPPRASGKWRRLLPEHRGAAAGNGRTCATAGRARCSSVRPARLPREAAFPSAIRQPYPGERHLCKLRPCAACLRAPIGRPTQT